jgi:transposase-like protein
MTKRFEIVENCPICNSMSVTVKPGYINRCYDCGTNWKV